MLLFAWVGLFCGLVRSVGPMVLCLVVPPARSATLLCGEENPQAGSASAPVPDEQGCHFPRFKAFAPA
jgi:hypothetical protein